MPLFKSNSRSSHDYDERNSEESPNRRRSIFSNRSSPPPPSAHSGGRKGIFGSVDDSDSDQGSRRGSTRSGGFFGRGNNDRTAIQNDPSIVAARQGVTDAEAAEREADRALTQAREKVKEAKRHVEVLEREALDE